MPFKHEHKPVESITINYNDGTSLDIQIGDVRRMDVVREPQGMYEESHPDFLDRVGIFVSYLTVLEIEAIVERIEIPCD